MIGGIGVNTTSVARHGGPYTGYGPLLFIESSVGEVESGRLLGVCSSVGIHASGQVVSIESDVQFHSTGSGNLVVVNQNVTSTFVGNVLSLEQKIIDATIVSHLERTGWDATITLGGLVIESKHIFGKITVDRSEGQASLAEFTLIPDAGFQSAEYYSGKTVTIDIQTASGNNRIYTGVVDIPELDLIEKKIRIRCTDRRVELINAQLGTVVKTIGSFSSLVFQNVKDTADELDKRLSTTPYSVDFDVFGQYTLTPWFAKSTPDFTLDNSNVYYSQPKVDVASRGRITNLVNVNFQYRYERLHHTQRAVSWTSPVKDTPSIGLRDSYSLTFRSMVQQAADAAGWPIRGNIAFDPIWPSGWYGGVAWSTISLTGKTTPKLDGSGNAIIDASGNIVYTTVTTGGSDYGPIYCLGAHWNATTRWTQTMTENYALVVQAPQSQSQYGNVVQNETYSTEAAYDASKWETYKAYSAIPGETTPSFSITQDTTRSDFNSALYTAVYKAKNTILGSHRDTKVTVSTFIFPEIDLKHTLKIDTDILISKGKVFSISHSLDVGTGEAVSTIVTSLFRAIGSQTDSAIGIPTKPTDTPVYPSDTIILGNHYGLDPSQPSAVTWTGMIGNKFNSNQIYRTAYNETFVVDMPAIPDNLRQEVNLNGGATYNVSIPNDTLTIIF